MMIIDSILSMSMSPLLSVFTFESKVPFLAILTVSVLRNSF